MPTKFTINLQQEKRSITEVHYYLPPLALNQAAPLANAMAMARNACLGGNAFVNLVTVSDVPADRHVNKFPQNLIPGDSGAPGNAEALSMFGNVSLLLNLFGSVGTTPAVRAPVKNYYLAFLRDEVFQLGGGGDFVLGPGDLPNIQQWMNFLVPVSGFPADPANVWGYRTRLTGNTQRAVSLAVSGPLPPFVQIVVPNPLINPATSAPAVPGDQVWLTGWRRLNPHIPPLEGAFRIARIDPVAGPPAGTGYTLFGTSAQQAGNYNNPGNMDALGFGYAAYTGWQPVKTVSRKRGASYGAPRGKSRVRTH